MLLIIAALLCGMKSVVVVEDQARNGYRISLKNWLCFSTLWLGMRPEIFHKATGKPKSDWANYVVKGTLRIALGGLVYFLAWLVWSQANSNDQLDSEALPWSIAFGWGSIEQWVATALLLLSLSLMIHFGIFNLLVGFWRWRGVNCQSLFRAPILSKSLTEFWGRRWNIAFSEMTSLAIFRPLKQSLRTKKSGSAIAMIAAFLFSGLLHELAISVPVKSGFGLPLLYFAIHGVMMFVESRSQTIEQNVWAGRAWTLAWVILPVSILFHRPFLEGCVWPLFG